MTGIREIPDILSIRNLSFSFPQSQKPLIKNFNLTLKTGEIVAVLGPSGCGKSTLLKLLAGLLQPTGGSVSKIGYKQIPVVFQEPALLSWLTVKKNLQLVTAQELIETQIIMLLKKLKLSGVESYYPDQLSGGMRMRVSLARALLQNSPVLFFDEAFAALDEDTRNELQVFSHAVLKQTQRAAIFITHSLSEAAFLADRVLMLSPRSQQGLIIAPIDAQLELPQIRMEEFRDADTFHTWIKHLRRTYREFCL
jgi:NitT/TauT family transport system ATP-binding protein